MMNEEEETITEAPTTPPPAAGPNDGEVSEKSNLAAFFTEDELKAIGAKVLQRYTRDVSSRAERMKKLKLLQKMYALITEPKNFPFQNAANIKTPALTGPELQIQARLYDMIWPANGKLFYAIPSTGADAPTAHVAEQFANSYVRYKMPYMAQGLDDTLHQMCLYGSAFRRTYWDAYERKVRSDWIPIEDFVVAHGQRSQDPSMSDVPRYTMVHHVTLADIEAYGAEGIFINTDKVTAASRGGDEGGSDFRDMARKIDGVSVSDDDEDADRQLLEQHCRLRLPKAPGRHPAFDGKTHYVVIHIDAPSQEVMRISLREEDDPDDKRRHDREMARIEEYERGLEAYEAALSAFQTHEVMTAQNMTIAGPMGVMDMMAPQQPQQEAPQHPGAPPEPPYGVDETGLARMPAPIRKRQICFFTHYRCFPSDGFYGIGYGDLLYGMAMAMNTILNQHIDGVTFRNAKPMFMSRQVRMQRGSVNIQPGEVVEIDGPVNQIRDAIMFLDPPLNDPTTVPLVNMLDKMKDSLSGSSDLMSGQIPGSNQTKGGMEILSEQLMMPISVLGRRVREASKHELEKIWRCFGVFLEDDDIADIVTDAGVPQQVQISRAMFSPTARLVPASDPRIKSQRIEDHMKLFGYCMNNPFIQQNPQAAPAIMRALTEEGFRIFPDGERLIPLLPPVQQEPEGPPPPKPQYAENAGFLRGEDSPVHPDDNDDEHMQDLMMFLQSPAAQVMDKTGRDMAERHLRAHQAAKIEKGGQQLDEQRAAATGALPGPQAPGLGPMEGPADLAPPLPMAQ